MMAVAPVVFLVDDDASVRTGVTRLLESAGYAVEAFASAREFLAREPSTGPCCLVLDIRMPGLSGLALQQTLAAAGRRMCIVFVTGHVDVPMSVRAMKAGAVDLLTKPVDSKDLMEAIQRAVTKDVRDRGEEDRAAEIQERVKLLTPREIEVFALVVTGMLNRSRQLGIAEDGQGAPRGSWKMRAGSVAGLVRLADALGVVQRRRTQIRTLSGRIGCATPSMPPRCPRRVGSGPRSNDRSGPRRLAWRHDEVFGRFIIRRR
jgi:FixJ family two-component response regulator